MDTQWPRYEVFEQEQLGQPHRNAGGVHAPDAEMALLNARDVFVRRPDCHSLWVAPASAIYARTAEELAAEDAVAAAPRPAGAPCQAYQIFQKVTQRQGETFVSHAGQVEAGSAAEALGLARQQFAGQPVYVWWVVPDSAIVRSAPGEAASLFAPALDKPYRQPGYYHVLTQMRAIRGADEGPSPDAAEADA